MWTILEYKRLARALKDAPLQVREKYEFWKSVVRNSGPEGLREIKGFHDEALTGRLRRHRSSRLNQGWRVLYQVDREELTVSVERVSDHDYRP